MAGFLIDTVLSYLQNPEFLSPRVVARIRRETMEELSSINQPVSPELEAVFSCIQDPHQLTPVEKRVFFQTLVTFVGTLENNPLLDGFDLGEVFGIFSRETHGIVHAFSERSLPVNTLVKKVLIFSLLISTGKVHNFEDQYQIYRSITTTMSQTEPTLRPLLVLFTIQQTAPTLEQIMTVFAQIYGVNISG